MSNIFPFLFVILAMIAGVFLAGLSRNKSIRIVIVLATIALGVPLLHVLNLYFARDLIAGYVSAVGDAFGISEMLSKAVSALLVVPVLFSLGLFFSLSKKRRIAGQILMSVGFAAYWLALWFATKDHLVTAEGEKLKCYTISQEGVRFFAREQFDQRTGEKCKWVDQSNLQAILAIDKKLKSGEPVKQLSFGTAKEAKFFVAGTHGAIPIVWYFKSTSHGYEFFDAPGVHPTFGTTLKPVTQAIVQDWVELINTRSKSKREALNRQQAAMAAQKKAATEKRKADTQKRLRSYLNTHSNKRFDWGIHIGHQPNNQMSLQAVQFLEDAFNQTKSPRVISPLFARGFIKEGYFRKSIEGDAAPLTQARTFASVFNVLLAVAAARCEQNPVSSSLTKCTISMRGTLFRGPNRHQPIVMDSFGAGFSHNAALKNAAARLVQTEFSRVAGLRAN